VPTVRQFEELLREAGFSKSLAAAIATKAAPHLRGDPGEEATSDFLDRLHAGAGNRLTFGAAMVRRGSTRKGN
jgi:hypothetical protein